MRSSGHPPVAAFAQALAFDFAGCRRCASSGAVVAGGDPQHQIRVLAHRGVAAAAGAVQQGLDALAGGGRHAAPLAASIRWLWRGAWALAAALAAALHAALAAGLHAALAALLAALAALLAALSAARRSPLPRSASCTCRQADSTCCQ
jgi:hypothetical protein